MKILVTSNSHPFYGQVVEITHRARVGGREVWVIRTKDGVTDYVREGEFRIVKRQEDGQFRDAIRRPTNAEVNEAQAKAFAAYLRRKGRGNG